MVADMSRTPPLAPGHPGRLRQVEETSAGGVVIDVRDGTALIAIIARHNRAGRLEWCLPKGHVEPGETLVQTAEREVAEETGIVGRALIELGTIHYWFSTRERRIHKHVHHYLLEAMSGCIGVEGDPDHEALEARWFPLDQVHRTLTFPNERRIAQAAWERLAGPA